MTAEEELDLRLAEPDEGEVIRLRVSYPSSPRTYTYAAVGFGGFWYLSGIDNVSKKTWADLISWFKSRGVEVLSLHRADHWEDLL